MENQAATLLSTLKRPAAPSETKLNLLNALKSDIKKYNIPPSAQPIVFECVKLAITQQASSTLASSAFSTLGHLIKRLKIQDASGNAIVQLAPRLFPALQDRLGDLRESVRNAAAQALGELYPFCTNDVEQIVRDEAMGGTNARAKETAMRWVLRMHNEEAMPFKGYVASIVARLEDADGGVREAAKSVLIELFSNAPDRAKTDLKRQLKAHSVRHAIESQILAQIGMSSSSMPRAPQATNHGEPETDMTGSTRSLPAFDHSAHLTESVNNEAAPPPPPEAVPMDPIYVHSQREVDESFRDMHPFFEGKEDEHNWMPRDKSILKVRRLLKGNAPNDFHTSFMAGIKSITDGIIKAANSLRTTMSTNGCQLVRELARTLGPALDPHVEVFLQSFIKMSAATKHIASENGRQTADTIFQHCSYNVRMMQHLWYAMQEKNVQPRQCATDWIKTILRRQSSYKQHFESSGGLELAEKCIKKGLDDANPKVKEGMRATYWIFAKSWPEKAEAIISKLDPKSKTALERDHNNPNAALHASQSSVVANSRSTGATSRNTLREMMAEQRRAKAAGKLPERPNSAMAELTPARPKHTPVNGAARGPSSLRNENRTISTASSVSAKEKDPPGSATAAKKGSLMSGPVRRPRRPEIQRPQTADPYASKRLLRPETPASGSPSGSPQRASGASKTSIPTSSAARIRPKASGSLIASPSGSPVKRSPLLNSGHSQMLDSRPTSKGSIATNEGQDLSDIREDDLTLVLPKGKSAVTTERGTFSPGHKRPGQTMSVDSGIPAITEDEGFTMVLPNLPATQPRARSPLAYRSPMKAMFDDARDKIGRLSPEAQRYVSQKTESTNGVDELRGGPVKTPPIQPEEIQIYEDPFTDNKTTPGAAEERKVLGELPVNENMRLVSPTQSQGSSGSPAGSPQHVAPARSPAVPAMEDRAEVLRNKRLLASGIERIRTKTLDAHGFRRVQDLAKSKLDIWDDGRKYNDLMGVLLEYLQTADHDPKLLQQPSKLSGLKAQALALMRALLTLHRKFAVAWHTSALSTVLTCRKGLDPSSHLLADLQRAADEIAQHAAPDACIDAVSTQLDGSGGDQLAAAQVAMALGLLRQLLMAGRGGGSSSGQNDLVGPERKTRLAQLAARHLGDADAEVRKADVDLASELFDSFGSDKAAFWTEFKGVDESRLGLLTYYIARRGKTVAR